MLRKEWARDWLRRLETLANCLQATGVLLVYLGDYDDGGHKIAAHSLEWYSRWEGFGIEHYAVTKKQLARVNKRRAKPYHELHIDGYIALIGPEVFARELREHLGLSGTTTE